MYSKTARYRVQLWLLCLVKDCIEICPCEFCNHAQLSVDAGAVGEKINNTFIQPRTARCMSAYATGCLAPLCGLQHRAYQ